MIYLVFLVLLVVVVLLLGNMTLYVIGGVIGILLALIAYIIKRRKKS